jgi:DNA-binding XRE family transcriptional regulator
MKTTDTRFRFIELRAQGLSFDRIAKELGASKQTLIDWSKELQEEIANRKALELERLYEAAGLAKESRIRALGGMLNKIEQELASRDLAEVPTEKLLQAWLQFSKQLEEERIDPLFRSSRELEEDKTDRELLEQLTALPSPGNRTLKAG